MEDEMIQQFYELRHAWNRLVYCVTKGLPREFQRALRRKLFGTTGLTYTVTPTPKASE